MPEPSIMDHQPGLHVLSVQATPELGRLMNTIMTPEHGITVTTLATALNNEMFSQRHLLQFSN